MIQNNPNLAFIIDRIVNPSTRCDLNTIPHSEALYSLILRHRVWHQVRDGLHGLDTPHPITTALSEQCKAYQQRLLSTAAETARLARLFNTQGFVHCFLKGITLNVLLYGALDTRPCRDIDVWVHPNDYARACACLLAAGYEAIDSTDALSGFKQRYWMHHHHHITFAHPVRQVMIELHFKMNHSGLRMRATPDEFIPIKIFNTPVYILQPDEYLLYLMIHGAQHAWVRLRWLNDVRLFVMNNHCDLLRVASLAREQQIEDVFMQACLLLQDLFHLKHPFLSEITKNPSRRARRLTQMAKTFLVRGEEKGVGKLWMLLKFRWYLIKLALPAEKIRCSIGLTFEVHELFSWITFSERLWFLYYLCYPAWLVHKLWRIVRGDSRADRARQRVHSPKR
jgi:hypothetical protein